MWFFHKRRDKFASAKKSDVQAEVVRVKGATRPSHQRPDTPSAQVMRHARIDRALQGFLSAENWEATHAALLRDHQVLLADDTLVVLREFIAQVRAQNQPNSQQMGDYLEAHRILLERARVVGVEVAWNEFRALRLEGADGAIGAPLDDPETQAIVDALRRLLGTESWNETFVVLVSERERLATDTAARFLNALIEAARQEDSPQAREGVRYLELHRTLLRDLRERGVNAAWKNFDRLRKQLEREFAPAEPASPASGAESDRDLPAVARALRAFLSVADWREARRILERDQALLLSDESDRLLSELLDDARRSDDPRAIRGVVNLGLHRRLLRHAREEGIDRAWREFEAALAEATGRANLPTSPLPPTLFDNAAEPSDDNDVPSAVEAFLGATSWDQAYAILRQRQHALLTDDAEALLHEKAEALLQRGTGRDLYAARLLDLQATLLRRARTIGIDRAWQEFEQNRD
jgi:hypothetical protein